MEEKKSRNVLGVPPCSSPPSPHMTAWTLITQPRPLAPPKVRLALHDHILAKSSVH